MSNRNNTHIRCLKRDFIDEKYTHCTNPILLAMDSYFCQFNKHWFNKAAALEAYFNVMLFSSFLPTTQTPQISHIKHSARITVHCK